MVTFNFSHNTLKQGLLLITLVSFCSESPPSTAKALSPFLIPTEVNKNIHRSKSPTHEKNNCPLLCQSCWVSFKGCLFPQGL